MHGEQRITAASVAASHRQYPILMGPNAWCFCRLCTPEMGTRDFVLCSWEHPEEDLCYTQGSHSQMHVWRKETLLHFLIALASSNHDQTGTQEAPSEHKETLFCCEDDQALEQVALRGCTVSILGGFQGYPKGIWPCFWATSSRWPCLSRGVWPDDLQRSLSTSNILWFYESSKLSSSKTCYEIIVIINESLLWLFQLKHFVGLFFSKWKASCHHSGFGF